MTKMYNNWKDKQKPSGYIPSDTDDWSDYVVGNITLNKTNNNLFSTPCSGIERNSLTNSDVERNSLITANSEIHTNTSIIAEIKKINNSFGDSDIRRNSFTTPFSSIERNSLTNSDIERNSLIATDGNQQTNCEFFNDSNEKMRCESVEKVNGRSASTVNNAREISNTKRVVEEQLRELVSKADGCLYCITKSYERYNTHTFEKCTRKDKWLTKDIMDKTYRNWIMKRRSSSGYIPTKNNNDWSDYAEGTSQMIEED